MLPPTDPLTDSVGVLSSALDGAKVGSASVANLLFAAASTFEGGFAGLRRPIPTNPWAAITHSGTGGSTYKIKRRGSYVAVLGVTLVNNVGDDVIAALSYDATLTQRNGTSPARVSADPLTILADALWPDILAAGTRATLVVAAPFFVPQDHADSPLSANIRALVFGLNGAIVLDRIDSAYIRIMRLADER